MKLNPDCVRAVMLCVEEHTGIEQNCYFIHYVSDDITLLIGGGNIGSPADYQIDLEKKYDNDEIFQAVKNCSDSGFFVLGITDSANRIMVKDLTPAGHNFVENIRTDKNWKKIQQLVLKAGALSAGAIADIATNVVLSQATQALSSMK